MKYILVKWMHQFVDEPVFLYSELDGSRFETRKVEIFPDGRKGYASKSEEFGTTRLGIDPVPPLREIAKDPQFEPRQITQEEFEKIWLERQNR